MPDVKKILFELTLFFGGLAGAFVSFNKDKHNTPWTVFLHLVSGGLISVFFTPFVADVFKMNQSAISFTSFVVGYAGYKSADFAVSYLKNKFKK
jgi:hypothetical protein